MFGIGEKSGSQEKIVTVLDIGSSKISCMVVALAPWAGRDHVIAKALPARLLGSAQQRSKGIKAGVVVDLGAAEDAIRTAVSRAERMAGVNIDEVLVNVSCGRLKSANFTARTTIAGGRVGDGDIARVLAAGRDFAERDARSLLQMSALAFHLDQAGGIRDPRDMIGHRLGADVHAVTVDAAPLRNLVQLIERCYLSVAGLVASPYASGLATVTAEEARLGVTCIDLGGGMSTLSVFAEGHFIYCGAVNIGGSHISYDIARALSTPLYEAERIKTLYGTLIGACSNEHESVPYPVIGQDDVELYRTTRAKLREVIRPRVEETLGQVRERLDASGFARFAGERVVLTGGASQLTGMGEFAAQFLGKAVRIGRPAPFGATPDFVTGPDFACSVGLLHALLMPGGDVVVGRRNGAGNPDAGYLGRVGSWFRQSFWEDEEELATSA